ncbi:MAG: class I SAM-dependent methyltransferase [Candidatus Dormibacteria bacterium]
MTPSVEDAARASFGARAEHYVGSATHADPDRLARIVALTEPKGRWRVLDVATGTGHTAFAFAPAVAWVTAVDLTQAMLDRAERVRKDRGYGNVDLQVADVHRLAFADAAFDLVTCRRAAHHFSDIAGALGEMRRVLKPGGVLMIDDRSSPEDHQADAILHRLDTLHDASHVRQYRSSEWARMLDAAGFSTRVLDEYVQDRPISAFTNAVPAADEDEVHRIVAGLTARQRQVLNFQPGSEGREATLRHFYLTIVAERA